MILYNNLWEKLMSKSGEGQEGQSPAHAKTNIELWQGQSEIADSRASIFRS